MGLLLDQVMSWNVGGAEKGGMFRDTEVVVRGGGDVKDSAGVGGWLREGETRRGKAGERRRLFRDTEVGERDMCRDSEVIRQEMLCRDKL